MERVSAISMLKARLMSVSISNIGMESCCYCSFGKCQFYSVSISNIGMESVEESVEATCTEYQSLI